MPTNAGTTSAERVIGEQAVAAVETAVADGVCGHDSPFHSAAWLEATLRHLATPPTLHVYRVLDEQGRTEGILPLVRDAGGLRAPDGRLADVQGPACRPAARATSVPALMAAAAADAASAAHVWLAGLPVDAADAFGCLEGSRRADEVTQAVDCRGSWDEYLASPRARRRRRISTAAWRACERADVEVLDSETHDNASGMLDTLVRLHTDRFGARSRVFDGPRLRFFQDVVPVSIARGEARLRVLVMEGHPTAAILLWQFARGWWYYLSGWDPALAERSPGRILFADTVRRAFADPGVDTFHLLRGDEPYKRWWATGPSFRVADVTVGDAASVAARPPGAPACG